MGTYRPIDKKPCSSLSEKFQGNRNTMIQRFNIKKCKEIASERGYEILSEEYLTTKEKMIFYHTECKNEFYMDWHHFYARNQGCDVCGKKERGIKRRTDENVCIEYAVQRGYSVVDEYYPDGNLGKYLNISHDECGFVFSMRWQDFKIGRGCPQCFGNTKLTIDFCKEEALKLNYKILDNMYFGNHIPLKFIHLECDYEFLMEWNSFYKRGSRCPECARKQQESKIATFLKGYYSKHYDAILEYEICINPKTNRFLPYDIFIPKYNKNGMDFYIEVQGQQHYSFDNFYHKNLKNFEYSKYKDMIKKKYAKKNGIFIEIDLRKKISVEKIIQKINEAIEKYG